GSLSRGVSLPRAHHQPGGDELPGLLLRRDPGVDRRRASAALLQGAVPGVSESLIAVRGFAGSPSSLVASAFRRKLLFRHYPPHAHTSSPTPLAPPPSGPTPLFPPPPPHANPPSRTRVRPRWMNPSTSAARRDTSTM